MTYNSILISKDGKLLAMNKPEKPTLEPHITMVAHAGFIKDYNEALQSSISAAEDEKIEFNKISERVFITLCNEDRNLNAQGSFYIKDHIGKHFACPSSWEIRVEEQCSIRGPVCKAPSNCICVHDGTKVKVALLVQQEKKAEVVPSCGEIVRNKKGASRPNS